jgi:hypothetical protein
MKFSLELVAFAAAAVAVCAAVFAFAIGELPLGMTLAVVLSVTPCAFALFD